MSDFDKLVAAAKRTASDPNRITKNQSQWGGVIIVIGKEDPREQPLKASYKALSFKRKQDSKNPDEIKVMANQGFVLGAKNLSKHL